MTQAEEAIDLAYKRHMETLTLISLLRVFVDQTIPVMEQRQKDRIQKESIAHPESRQGSIERAALAISKARRALDSAFADFRPHNSGRLCRFNA